MRITGFLIGLAALLAMAGIARAQLNPPAMLSAMPTAGGGGGCNTVGVNFTASATAGAAFNFTGSATGGAFNFTCN